MQSLQVIEALHEDFQVVGLSAHTQVEQVAQQARRHHVRHVAISDPQAFARAQGLFDENVHLYCGQEGLLQMCKDLAEQIDLAVVAIVGIAGLRAVVQCIYGGMDIALANKEALVTGGFFLQKLLKQTGRRIFPVDSEHSAIFQCLQGLADREITDATSQVKRLILTASGGPFFGYSTQQLRQVTPQQALKHPNWSMGAKITIDSATLMNKALEVIEAHWLFHVPPEQIEVIVHRQSVIHSMVELQDHSVLAQMGEPDMRVPIQYALSYPRHQKSLAQPLDLLARGTLSFEAVDQENFPGLDLGYEALRRGTGAAVALNAANEVAVELFLQGKIAFLDIASLNAQVMRSAEDIDPMDLDKIMWLDTQVRKKILWR